MLFAASVLPAGGYSPPDDLKTTALTDYAYKEYTRLEYESILRVGLLLHIDPEPVPMYSAVTGIREWPTPSREDAKQLIEHWSNVYDISTQRAMWTVQCESGYNARAKNRVSSAAGLWQFLRGTFNRTAVRMGHPEWTYEEYVWNAEVNAQMGAWLAANDSFSHWECGGFTP